MLDERVTAIHVSSPLVPQFLVMETPPRRFGEIISLEKPVLHDGEVIGHVRVKMDAGPLKSQLTVQWVQTLLTGLLQFGTGILIIFVLLRYKVLGPLKGLVGQSQALAAGKLDQSWTWRRNDELGVLGRSFEDMRHSLRESFFNLQRRNQELKKREIELANQASVLKAILDNMTDGITLVDERLRLVAWNNRVTEIMGIPRDRIHRGMSIEELAALDLSRGQSAPTERDTALRAVRGSFDPDRPYAIQFRIASGQWINIRRRPMPGGGFVSTYTDVTEQVEARRKADQTLLLLEAVMDAVPAMLHVKDRDLRYLMVNREFLECWGFKREEFLGKTSRDMFPRDISHLVEPRDRQVLETGKPLPFAEITYQGNRAEPITVWSTKVPLIDAGGKVTHIVTVDVDISERKQAEQERQRWAQLLHDAIESIPNGFAVYDASRRLVICNTAFASLYGIAAEALVGISFFELAPRLLEQVQTIDGRPPEAVKKTLSLERYWAAYDKPLEVQLKDGRWFLINRHSTAEGGIVVVRSDITYLKRMEQALRDSEQRFRTIAETHPVPSVIFTADDHRLIYASPGFADLIGSPLTRLLGLSADDFYVDSANHDRFWKTLKRTGFVESYELALRKTDGSTVDVSISARPLSYQGEQAILASIFDLTERKKTDAELARHREALHQSEKLSALGSLLAGVSHELNNPLSVVVGRAIMLEEEFRDSDLARSIGKIRAAAERCARIVKTFLAMARRQELARVPIQIREVIESSLGLIGYGLRASGVEVSLEVEPDLPELMADPDQLTQVFTNLFVNAQQALTKTTPPRRLVISARCDNRTNALRIRVSDNGPGIPKEVLPRIFEPFFTTKPVGEGTGLGLSVSQGIVEAHGGTISVEIPAGGGTTFEIVLPIQTTVENLDTEADTITDTAGARRILLVDDIPEVAQMLADILDDAGHYVEIAENGRVALSCLEHNEFDLIISDLRMPELDGPGLYAELQSHHPQLLDRLIFITGDTLSEPIKRFLARANRPVIEKPFIPKEIRRLVAQVLEQDQVFPLDTKI